MVETLTYAKEFAELFALTGSRDVKSLAVSARTEPLGEPFTFFRVMTAVKQSYYM